jgi:hypothetical protein
MRNLRNIDRDVVRSFIRDGFLPPEILAELGAEDRLNVEQVDEVGANRLWLDRGNIFIAVAVHLSNLGDHDRIVAECCCELEWAKHVELLEKSAESYSKVFIAGGEEFARSTALNSSIIGARLPKCGGSLDGVLLFKAYGLPTPRLVAPRMTAKLNIVFANGIEAAAPATLRVQAIEELLRVLPAQPVAAAPAPGVAVPALRSRRPLFNAGKEP